MANYEGEQREGNPLFPLGQCVITPGASEALTEAEVNPSALLGRHQRGDWGSLSEDDMEANQWAVETGERILSAYILTTEVDVWVITERDRSYTTILLPSEY